MSSNFEYGLLVAQYMFSMFKVELASRTCAPDMALPAQPPDVSNVMNAECKHLVSLLVTAYLRPGI